MRRSESPFDGVLVLSFIAALLGWKLMEYEEKSPQLFVEGKCGEARQYREEGRKERGRRDIILMDSFHQCLPYFLNDDDDERCALP